MTYKGAPLTEKLDRLAEATGVPRLSRKLDSAYPTRFRVLPAIFLTVAVAGMGLQIARGGLSGFWIVWAGWMGALILQPFGGLRQRGTRKLDEREAAVLRHGHFVGMMWALGLAMLGSMTIAFGSAGAMLHMWNLWAPQTPMDWMTITLFLLAVENNVAVLAASAATPEPLEDEEE
ncbi:MAG TPA: hypothetical protein VIC34_10435 [Croceibacterium sp.]|jgi:hypothetical protein